MSSDEGSALLEVEGEEDDGYDDDVADGVGSVS